MVISGERKIKTTTHTPASVGDVCFCKTTDTLQFHVTSASILCRYVAVLYVLARFRYKKHFVRKR